MKKIILYSMIFAGILTSCSKSEFVENGSNNIVEGGITFVANSDNSADTKTSLDGLDIKWVAADPVMIFGKDNGGTAKVSGYAAHEAGASTTLDWTTSISGTEGAFVTGETPEYALYPTDADNASISGSVITFKLPETQTYAANSFGQNANVAVGRISSLEGMADIKFKNVCGYLKLPVTVAEGDAAKVGRIVLTTKGTEKLWGTFEADASLDAPVATYKSGATDGSTSVTLNCPDGVAVSTDASNPTVFYIVVPVGALADGFKAEVYSSQNHLMTTLETSKDVTVARNQVNRMANKSFNWIPAAYTECEYISIGETKGPCINSGVLPYYGMDISMKFGWYPSLEYTGEDKGPSTMLFQVEQYPTTLIDFQVYRKQYNSGSTIYCQFAPRFMGTAGGKVDVTSGSKPNCLHIETTPIHSFTVQFRETTSYCYCPTASPEYNITITNHTSRPTMPTFALGFLGGKGPSGFYGGASRIDTYEISIVNQSGTGTPAEKERRFIPVRSSSSEYGMFDLVTDAFFGNVGTGEFSGKI